jgi:hypothetical protein
MLYKKLTVYINPNRQCCGSVSYPICMPRMKLSTYVFNIRFRAGAASRCGSGSTKMMRLLEAQAPQHGKQVCKY